MKNHSPRASGRDFTHPAVATSRRKQMDARVRRGIMRITAPSIEAAERRMRNTSTFLSSLTPDQRAAILEYDGPEVLGCGGPKRKNPLPSQG